jgi:hypothetical protein
MARKIVARKRIRYSLPEDVSSVRNHRSSSARIKRDGKKQPLKPPISGPDDVSSSELLDRY